MLETSPLSIPHRAGELDPPAFHLQLRRLESLQSLMVQGASVVNDVVLFMTKVREELALSQRDHACISSLRESAEEEKLLLIQQVEELGRSHQLLMLELEEKKFALQRIEQKGTRLNQSAMIQTDAPAREQNDPTLRSITARATELESALMRERELCRETVEQAALSHSAEIAQLKTRLVAVEQQLNLERERRDRLMAVVKTQELQILPRGERENVS